MAVSGFDDQASEKTRLSKHLSGFMRVSERLAYVFFALVLFQAAHWRSEETMQANYFDSMILGTITNGQGSMNAVEGMHRAALRAFVLKFARRLSLRLGAWRALSMKRMPAATATPIAATCPSSSASRFQRQQRWVPGVVVVDAGTVGVC